MILVLVIRDRVRGSRRPGKTHRGARLPSSSSSSSPNDLTESERAREGGLVLFSQSDWTQSPGARVPRGPRRTSATHSLGLGGVGGPSVLHEGGDRACWGAHGSLFETQDLVPGRGPTAASASAELCTYRHNRYCWCRRAARSQGRAPGQRCPAHRGPAVTRWEFAGEREYG